MTEDMILCRRYDLKKKKVTGEREFPKSFLSSFIKSDALKHFNEIEMSDIMFDVLELAYVIWEKL